MLVDTPESVAFEAAFTETPAVPNNVDEMFDAPAVPVKVVDTETPVDEPQSELPVANEPQPITPVELSEEDEAERRWWAKVEVIGKIRDCSRLIEETESEIDGYQDAIKEAKEVLKGQQALLNRYSSQLADILDGHPLPKNPAAAIETPSSVPGPGEVAVLGVINDEDWRNYLTSDLLKGVTGLGPKKLDAITELAPTAGQLEDLRGQASMAYKTFKEVLPKGCGDNVADAIENRLIDHIAKCSAAFDVEPRSADMDECDVEKVVEPKTQPVTDSEEYEDVE